MRIKAEEMEKRTSFVKEILAKHPDFNVAAVNEAVKKKFGSGMTPSRISDIKKQTTTTPTNGHKPEVVAEAQPEEMSHEGKGAISAADFSRNAVANEGTRFREGTPEPTISTSSAAEEAKAIEEATAILKKVGATDIHINYTITRKLDA